MAASSQEIGGIKATLESTLSTLQAATRELQRTTTTNEAHSASISASYLSQTKASAKTIEHAIQQRLNQLEVTMTTAMAEARPRGKTCEEGTQVSPLISNCDAIIQVSPHTQRHEATTQTSPEIHPAPNGVDQPESVVPDIRTSGTSIEPLYDDETVDENQLTEPVSFQSLTIDQKMLRSLQRKTRKRSIREISP